MRIRLRSLAAALAAAYRGMNDVVQGDWSTSLTGAVKVAPTWGGVAVYGTTASRLAAVKRALDSDGACDWLFNVETLGYLGAVGVGDRSGPGLIDNAGTNCKYWVLSAGSLYIGTEVATVPSFTLIGSVGVDGFHVTRRGRVVVAAGTIGAGARACDLYLFVDSTTPLLFDSDTIDASAVAIVTQGGATAATRNQICLVFDKKVD